LGAFGDFAQEGEDGHEAGFGGDEGACLEGGEPIDGAFGLGG
jgi:hypothetical protein